MSFVSGAAKTNVDILFSGMPRVPDEGEEIYASGFSLQLGGGAPATLINLSRLGVPTRIQTFLGQDFFSLFAQRQYETFDTSPLNLYSGDHMPVNVSASVITPRDRAFISYSDPLTVTDADLDRVFRASLGARIVLMQDEFLPVYPKLKENGSILVYDTGWREDMSLESMSRTLELADWYVPNEMEATRLTNTRTPGEAAVVLSRFFRHVVIKLGSKGCLIRSGEGETIVRPVPDVQTVDTTGAGDAFLAGFVYGLYHGASPAECALYGNITGAACVDALGCLTSLIDREELQRRSVRYRYLIG